MISKIVGNIFYAILVTISMVGFVGAIIASGVWFAKSGELIIIALIVTFVIGFAVMLVLTVITIKQLVDDCFEIDKILKEVQNGEDKG